MPAYMVIVVGRSDVTRNVEATGGVAECTHADRINSDKSVDAYL